jgi:hypothetical protein
LNCHFLSISAGLELFADDARMTVLFLDKLYGALTKTNKQSIHMR